MTRIEEEIETVENMITLYCRHVHHYQELCPQCEELRTYAVQRLQHCPFQEDKTSCKYCRVHCYNPLMRAKIKVVMRYAGPRMILYHPMAAIRHIMRNKKSERQG